MTVLARGPGEHPFWYREYLFEKIRRLEFPGLPSRMAVAYAYEGLPPRDHATESGQHTYVVTFDARCPAHRADMSWITAVRASRSFDQAEECARQYWGGVPSRAPLWEWLVAGRLEVVAAVPDALDATDGT